MPRAVGLDIGTRLLKLVELSGSPKSFKIQRLVVEPWPEGKGEEADAVKIELVRRLFAENRLPKDDVCAAFDAGSAIFRDVMVPFRDDAQIEKVVRFEAENHLHGRAIEDVIVNWVRTGDTKDGSQLIVMAAPKAELAERLGLLHRAGVEPASVDLDATAVFTACEASGVFAEDPSVVILEIGARTTTMLVVDGGRLKSVRSFLVGAETVTSGVQSDLSLPPGDAAARTLRPGPSDPGALLVPASDVSPSSRESSKSVAELEHDTVQQRREEFVRKLHREILRSTSSARSETPFTKILVAGGGSLLPGLSTSLAERIELPVEPLGILKRLGYEPKGENAALEEAVSPVALGCALRLIGVDSLGVELRKEEFAPSNTFEVVRGVLALSALLVVLLLGGLVWMAKEGRDRELSLFLSGTNSVSSKAATILQSVEERYQQDVKGKSPEDAKTVARRLLASIPNDPNYLFSVRNQLSRRYRELEENLGLSKDIPSIESALKVWREIYFTFGQIPREELGFFRINKMSITQQSASMTLEIDSQSNLDKIVAALNVNEYLKGRAKDPSRQTAIPGNMQLNNMKRSTVSIEIPFADETR